MKRVFLLMMCISLCLILAGCSKAGKPVPESWKEKSAKKAQMEEEKKREEEAEKPEVVRNEDKVVEAPKIELDREFVVVIDPGHGGKFSGAEGGGLYEQDETLKLAKYVFDRLSKTDNVKVLLTRERDVELDSDLAADLEKRCEFAKENGADLLVSLHFNASDDHSAKGTCVYVTNRKKIKKSSEKLAESLIGEICGLGLENRGVLTRNSNDMMDDEGKPLDYYAILRHSSNRGIVSVIVECCFIDNESDREFIETEEAKEALADAITKGILKYCSEN